MKTRERVVWVLVVVFWAAASWAAEPLLGRSARLSPLRVEPAFSGNYLKDALVIGHRQLRGEFSGQVFRKFERIDIHNYDFLVTVGVWPRAELGVDVPIVNLDPRGDVGQELGVGDISIWGKYNVATLEGLAAPDDFLALTVGFEFQAETADDSQRVPCDGVGATCGMGIPEHGYNPFASFRYATGNVALAGHVGYEFFESPVGEVFNWDVSPMVALAPDIFLRLELVGLHQFDGDERHIFSVAPGIDWVLDYITLRVAGFKGATDDAADWGLGGGVALRFGRES